MAETVYWQPIEKSLPVLFGEYIGMVVEDDDVVSEDQPTNHLVKTYHGTVMVPDDQIRWVE